MTPRPLPIVLAVAAALPGCAAHQPAADPPRSAFAAARLAPPAALTAQQAADAAGSALPPAPAPAGQPLPGPPLKARESGTPLARVAAANRTAAREPTRHGYVNAVQVYDWAEGALYLLYTAPERVSEIALEPGETLLSVAAGDTVRWIIGDTTSGKGPAQRTHVLVKPAAAGLRTNLVIATDRRVYHVALESTAGPAMASMSWTYPADALLALRGAPSDAGLPASAEGPALDTLDFAYTISGDDPPWRPLRAFDDGHQVYIEFPAGLGEGEAPPLFVRGAGARPELVNYRVRGRYYVVDRLFEVAELRLGGKRQQVVRIAASGRTAHRRSAR